MTQRPANRASEPASLYAALLVPDFPVAVLQAGQARPGPAVAAAGRAPQRFVHAANQLARERGVREGMALAAARARFQSASAGVTLRLFARDEGSERRMQRRLLQLAETVTPCFEDVAPGSLVLDLSGLRTPRAAVQELIAGAALLGLQARVGVSRNRFVALCAAHVKEGVTHVAPGREAGFLQALPLGTLPLEGGDAATLRRWGVRRVGDLARLPEEQLVERFGERGARMARLARGEQASVLQSFQPPARLELRQEFDWEIDSLEPLVVAMSEMLDRLCSELQSLDRAAGSVTASLALVNGSTFERTIRLPCPLADPRALLALVRTDLSKHLLDSPVDGVQVSVEPVPRRRMQQSLFAPDLPVPEDLAVTLARLSEVVGGERVGTPVVADTHRPCAAAQDAFQVAAGKRIALVDLPAAGPFRSGSLLFRCFRPFQPADVGLRGSKPAHVDSPEARGAVTACAGPWRVSGEWWTGQGWQYQEWDVEVEGRLYRALCDRASGHWFLAGEYD